MAEGDTLVTNPTLTWLLSLMDLTSVTVKAALLDDTYTPNIDAHEFFDDVSAYEVSGTGYTAGGVALSGKSVSQDDTDDEAVFDASDVSFGTLGVDVGNIGYAVVYVDTGTPSTSRILWLIEAGFPANGGPVSIQWNAEGALNLG